MACTADYSGGGTYFEELDTVITLDGGEILTFDAKLVHQGLPITRGCRFLMVGFCYTEDAREASQPGNVSTALDLIPTAEI